jgi:DNA polymerase III, delta subunit
LSSLLGLKRAQEITKLLGDESNGVSSILLYGPRGCGKTLLVNQLVEMWLASKSDPGNRSIESFRRGANPDFHHIRPSGPSNIITVGQISPSPQKKSDDPVSLIEYVRVSPLYSRNKAIWIEDVHRLNRNASNSLLKTLEEPPEYVKLILTSNQISQVPATILSRCLVINCELPTQSELVERFPDVPQSLHILAEGSPGTMGRISQNTELYEDIIKYSDRLTSASPHHALFLSEEFKRLSDRLEDQEKNGARNSNARILELIGIAISHRYGYRADAIKLITEAHRRIIFNANSTLVLDAMIGKIMIQNKVGTNR